MSLQRTIELGGGRLVTSDGAIQLLLIIDHIFDWARDVYRAAILHHLNLLSATDPNETISRCNDSDIFSMVNPISRWANGIQALDAVDGMELDEVEEEFDDIRPLRKLDSHRGVFRHSGFIVSELLGLHIIGDNLETLMSSRDTKADIQIYACTILDKLLNEKSLSLTEGTLNELEDLWTGAASHLENALPSNSEFVVRVLLRSWLTDDWEQVRGLSYLAVSKNDLDLLIRISGSKKHFKSFGLTCNEESVIDLFRRYRSDSPKSNLEGAIERRTFSLEMGTDPFDGVSSELTFARDERRDEAYDIIHEAYRRHKIGLRKVKEPFIRNSTRIDGPPSIEPSDSPPAHRINIFTSNSGESFVYNHNIHIPECRYIVVVADCNEIGFPDPPVEVCFSMVSGPPKTPTASDVMKALHETLRANLPVYKTSLYAKPSLSGEWNLSATYGGGQTPYQSERIQTWIDHLSKKTGYFP